MFSHKLMVLLPLAALAFPACAAQQSQAPQAQGQQGMVVVRDADTGELRAPTPAEARALHPPASAAAAAAAPAPRMLVGPGGRRSVQLGERHMVYSVVTRDAEGKLVEQCVHGSHAAEHALGHGNKAPASAKKKEEHRDESR